MASLAAAGLATAALVAGRLDLLALGCGVLAVLHDPNLAAAYADRTRAPAARWYCRCADVP